MTDLASKPDTDGRGHGPGVDVGAGLILAGLCAAVLVWLIPGQTQQPSNSFDMAPGFFPAAAAWTVLLLAAGLTIHRIWRKPLSILPVRGRAITVEVAIWTGMSALAVLGLLHAGFYLTGAVLIAGGMLLCGCRTWWLIATIALSFPFFVDQAAWLIFTVDLP